MGFLDEVVISTQSGSGGRGCVSFLRERFKPKGGPDGGDGGDGGNIIVRATNRLFTLTDYSSRKQFKASDGRPGRGKSRTGRDGEDIVIHVPPGTVIYDVDSGRLIADLTRDQEEILVLEGGKGGKGNQHFATSTNRAPRFAQPGLPGQYKRLRLSLKSIADIGLVGLPNAGKSTLLSRLTQANPKIDDYPFTTTVPNLGILHYNDRRLTLADIPGLIEGASLGKGLGHRFLKHIERTKILLHLLDLTYRPKGDILEDYTMLRNELGRFNPALKEKAQVVVLNKIDIHRPDHRNLDHLKRALENLGVVSLTISALKGEGLEALKRVLAEIAFDDSGGPFCD
jgi:GTP-binding protein